MPRRTKRVAAGLATEIDLKIMNPSTNSHDVKEPKAFVTCALCGSEVPFDEAIVPEATDQLVYLCGIDCYARWRRVAAISFPSLLAGPRL